MIKYDVKISGPGMCINNVLAVVQDALKKAGFIITVDNDHPPENGVAEHLKFVETLKDPGVVHIVMNHIPWGS